MKVVSIFGNVGVGKSTLLKLLEQEQYIVYYEPQDFWDPFFKLYIENPAEWAFAFQIIVLKGYEEMYKKIMSESHQTVFIERGVDCCTSFCKWLIHKQQLTDSQVRVIESYRDRMQWFDNIDYVYLKASPAICAARALSRENEINPCKKEYMEFLHAEWEHRAPTHVIDAEKTPDLILTDFKKLYTRSC